MRVLYPDGETAPGMEEAEPRLRLRQARPRTGRLQEWIADCVETESGHPRTTDGGYRVILLPAFTARWSEGSVTGLQKYAGRAAVELGWRQGQPVKAWTRAGTDAVRLANGRKKVDRSLPPRQRALPLDLANTP